MGGVIRVEEEPSSARDGEARGSGTLSVDVWQIYIQGKKPEKLEGSRNDAIRVDYPPSYSMQTVRPPAATVDND